MKNKLAAPIIIVLLVFCAWFFYKWKTSVPISEVNSTVMLNKIEKVMKMVNIEANFSELLTYEDYDYIDFPGFRKKAIIKVDAKVLAGFDMNKMKFEVDEINKTIIIKNIPKSEVLAIDHQLSYYDMQQGIFNAFDEKTLTSLQEKAKALIAKKVQETDILQQADAQKLEIFSLIYYMAKSTGWKIEIEGKELKETNGIINYN